MTKSVPLRIFFKRCFHSNSLEELLIYQNFNKKTLIYINLLKNIATLLLQEVKSLEIVKQPRIFSTFWEKLVSITLFKIEPVLNFRLVNKIIFDSRE